MNDERYPIKLVRDEIEKAAPNVAGGRVAIWNVGQTSHVRLLKAKLLEEVGEYLVGGGAEELADIQEVIDALAKVAEGCTANSLREIKIRKLRQRGGFMQGRVMYAEPPQPFCTHKDETTEASR